MFRRLLNLFRPRDLEADIQEEIAFHRAQSSGAFGNATLIADRMRDMSTVAWLESFLQDIRFGFRQLWKSPALLIVAVLSLSLGVGANTAIFTLIHAVMLQLLPVRDPAGLVLLSDAAGEGTTSGDLIADAVSYPFYKDLRARNAVFQSLCAFRQGEDEVTLHISGNAQTGDASVHLVSGNYFDVLGVEPIIGRFLRESDDTPASPPVAVLSFNFWTARFRQDPAVLGKTVVLNGTAFVAVGVADASFFGERVRNPPDFWLPLSFQPRLMIRDRNMLEALNTYWLNGMGRLKPGITRARAQAAVNEQLHSFYLAQAGPHPTEEMRRKIEQIQIKLKPGGSGISGLRYLYSKPLLVLMAVVAVVLLIACANIATLLLARASSRRQEFLCRLALGAARIRLLRQMLVESILLALIGGLAGMLFAWWSVKALILFISLSPVVSLKPNTAVLAFALAVSTTTGILFGILPAWKLSRLHPRSESAVLLSWGSRRFGGAQTLIAAQVALSLSLLLGAGLLVHSFIALEEQDIGFTRDRILLIRTDADLAGYQPSGYAGLYQEVVDRVGRIPSVKFATIARFSPLSGYNSSGNFSILGHPTATSKNLVAWDLSVGPEFFNTLRIPLLLGRPVGLRDTAASAPVAVVNQKFVDEYLPGANPIGQRVEHGSPFKAPGREIVGVVADSKFFDLRENAKPMVFYPLSQMPSASFEIILRSAAEPGSIATQVRTAIEQINGRLPILEQNKLNDQVESSLRQQKMVAMLCSLFGVLATLLACIGIYGTLAYSVANRTPEIGIRMATGAQRSQILSLVLRDLVRVLFIGLILGAPLAWLSTRWLKSFLFAVEPLDPFSIAAATAIILILSLLAGYLPARRASKIEPMRALRHE